MIECYCVYGRSLNFSRSFLGMGINRSSAEGEQVGLDYVWN